MRAGSLRGPQRSYHSTRSRYAAVRNVQIPELVKTVAADVDRVDKVLDEKDKVREQAIKMSRDIIRVSSDIVTLVHSGNTEGAAQLVNKLKDIVVGFSKLVEPHSELRHSGFVNNALAEYVEAMMFFNFVVKGRVPTLEELGVHYVPYLLGLCDFVGELRRHVMDLVRVGSFDRAFEILELMEGIYEILRKLDYPDALVPGLRHKVDVMRRLIDDIKMFLVDLKSRRELSEAIREALQDLARLGVSQET